MLAQFGTQAAIALNLLERSRRAQALLADDAPGADESPDALRAGGGVGANRRSRPPQGGAGDGRGARQAPTREPGPARDSAAGGVEGRPEASG